MGKLYLDVGLDVGVEFVQCPRCKGSGLQPLRPVCLSCLGAGWVSLRRAEQIRQFLSGVEVARVLQALRALQAASSYGAGAVAPSHLRPRPLPVLPSTVSLSELVVNVDVLIDRLAG